MDAKIHKKMNKPKSKRSDSANLDLDPDAWPKFEKLIKNAAQMGHKPHLQSKLAKTRKKK